MAGSPVSYHERRRSTKGRREEIALGGVAHPIEEAREED